MIDPKFVVAVQKSLVADCGLSTELADEGKLEAALMRVENRIRYGIIRSPIEKAAWYAAAIARGHCFSDANKRTSFLVLVTMLAKEGLELPFNLADELENLIVELASGELKPDDFASWLSQALS